MTEERIEKFRNGLDAVLDSTTLKYVLVGVGILVLIYASGYILQIITSTVIAYKGLMGAINKP